MPESLPDPRFRSLLFKSALLVCLVVIATLPLVQFFHHHTKPTHDCTICIHSHVVASTRAHRVVLTFHAVALAIVAWDEEEHRQQLLVGAVHVRPPPVS